MRSIFSLRVLISSFSWVILIVLKVDMAMAAMEMPIAINRSRALMMLRKSSSDPSMIYKLTSVTDLVIDLKGSSCCSRS
jgi:hypothetical protein